MAGDPFTQAQAQDLANQLRQAHERATFVSTTIGQAFDLLATARHVEASPSGEHYTIAGHNMRLARTLLQRAAQEAAKR